MRSAATRLILLLSVAFGLCSLAAIGTLSAPTPPGPAPAAAHLYDASPSYSPHDGAVALPAVGAALLARSPVAQVPRGGFVPSLAPQLSALAAEELPQASEGLSFTERQLQSQLAQHGEEWGFGDVSNNAATREEFLSRLVDHIDDPGTTRIEGTWRGQEVVHYVNDQGLNVFTTPEGGFWGAWRLNSDQLWNVITRGSL